MPMILRLCRRVILLGNGKILADGTPHEVTREYLHSDAGSPGARTWPTLESAPGDSVARLKAVRILNNEGEVAELIDIRKPVSVQVEYWNLQSSVRPVVSLHFINEDGTTLFMTNDQVNAGWWNTPRTPGLVRSSCRVPGNFLAEGRVFILVALCSYNPDVVHAIERDAVSFQVIDQSEGDGVRGEFSTRWPGVVRPMLDWRVSTEPTP
jgi:lipopolysaccharide transport system ATP-binding protein